MKYVFLSDCGGRYWKPDGVCWPITGFSNSGALRNFPYDRLNSADYSAVQYGGVAYDDNGDIDYQLYNCAICDCHPVSYGNGDGLQIGSKEIIDRPW